MKLLLAAVAWRLMRRIAGPAIVIALAVLLLHSGSFASHDRGNPAGPVERIVQPIKHDLQQSLERVLRR